MKERKLYSLTGKLIVFLLLIVFAASALFGGIQTLMLSSVGLTPNAAAKKYAFEETTACGTLVQRQLHNVMSYYNDMSKFGTNGRYDGTKEIDYRAFATDGEGSGSTPIFTGASAGWKCITVRTSFFSASRTSSS